MNKQDGTGKEEAKNSLGGLRKSIMGSSVVRRLSTAFGAAPDSNTKTKKPTVVRKSTQRNEFSLQDYNDSPSPFGKERPYVRTMAISFLNAQNYENWNAKFDKLAEEVNQLQPDIVGIYDIKLGETFASLPPLEYFLSKINLPYQAVFQPEKSTTSFVVGGDVDGCMVLTRYKIYETSTAKLSKGKTDTSGCMCLLLRMMTPFGIIDFGIANISYEFEVIRENFKEIKKFLDLESRKGTRGQIIVGNLNLFLSEFGDAFLKTTEKNLEDGFYDIVTERSAKIGNKKDLHSWDLHRSVYYRGRFIEAYRDDLEHELMLERTDEGALKDEEKAYCLSEFVINESLAVKELAYYLFEEGQKDAKSIRGIGGTILNQAQKNNTTILEALQQQVQKKGVNSNAFQEHLQKIAQASEEELEGWSESLIVVREFENNEKFVDTTQGAVSYCLSSNKVELDGKIVTCQIKNLSFYKEKFVINKKKTVF